MRTNQLSITGMHCNGCVKSVTRALLAVNGVKSTEISLASGTGTVEFDEQLTSVSDLSATVLAAGYNMDDPESAQSMPPRSCCSG